MSAGNGEAGPRAPADYGKVMEWWGKEDSFLGGALIALQNTVNQHFVDGRKRLSQQMVG